MDLGKGTTVLYEFKASNESNSKSRTRFYYSLVLIILAILAGTIIVVVYGKVMIKELSKLSSILKDNRENSSSSVTSSDNNSTFLPKVINNLGANSENISETKINKVVWPDTALRVEDELNDKSEDISDEDFFNFETNPKEAVEFTPMDFKLKADTNVNSGCEQSAFDKQFVKTLSNDERHAVKMLKEKVSARLWEPFCDASSENYLARHLKDKKWDVEEAESAILKTFAWRKKEKVDEVLKEDFTFFENELPIYMDGKDKAGQIVMSMDASSGDFRKIILAGKKDQMTRYYIRTAELLMESVRQAQFRGENVTQALIIENFEGFNRKQHGCNKCIAALADFFFIFLEHYPGAITKYLLINVPMEIEWIISVALSVFPPEITQLFQIFGTNKQEWQKAILEMIPTNQIRPSFGGTMKTEEDILMD